MRSLMTRTRVLAATVVATGLFTTACTSDATGPTSADGRQTGSEIAPPTPGSGNATDLNVADLLRPAGLTDLAKAVESSEPGTAGRVLVEGLEKLPIEDRPTSLMAQVRADSVVLTDQAGGEASLSLPEDRFYLSVAPFLEQTHPCSLHSLTTCRGELADTKVEVSVQDESGAVVFEDALATEQNGFVGLWLPTGITGTVRMQAAVDGATVSGEAPIGTGPDDVTCLTTLQMA